jgi:hypothetical protein
VKYIRDLIGRELKWVHPHATKMEFELRDGEVAAATLRFRSFFGSLATAESADGSWTFKRMGFLQTKATVRALGSEQDLGVFKNNTWRDGGTLELPDGRKFPADTNCWATKCSFKTESGVPLVSFQKIGGVLHMSSAVQIHEAARDLPELPWIALLGWYLTVMMHMDRTAMAAATT